MQHAIRRALLPLAILTAFLAANACSDSDGPTEPRGRFEQRLTLRAGQLRRFEPEGVTIAFVEITQDSRCPINAICIQAGEASGLFEIRVRGSLSELLWFGLSTLHPRTVEIEGYRITLESMAPSPTGQPIPPGDYVAELTIQRD